MLQTVHFLYPTSDPVKTARRYALPRWLAGERHFLARTVAPPGAIPVVSHLLSSTTPIDAAAAFLCAISSLSFALNIACYIPRFISANLQVHHEVVIHISETNNTYRHLRQIHMNQNGDNQ